jgi:hypothetical protein
MFPIEAASVDASGFYFAGPTSGPDYQYVRDRYQHLTWR